MKIQVTFIGGYFLCSKCGMAPVVIDQDPRSYLPLVFQHPDTGGKCPNDNKKFRAPIFELDEVIE